MVDGGEPGAVDSRDEGKHTGRNDLLNMVTVTKFRSISMPAGLRRHLVGKTLRNVCYSILSLKHALSVG